MSYTYYQQRVRHIDVDVTETNKFHIYTIHPQEHGTIFTAHGDVANNSNPIIFVLPLIQEWGADRTFTFKGGPTSKIVIAAHYGLLAARPNYPYCEGVTMAQYEHAYRTEDYVVNANGLWRFITWDSSAGGVNHSITLQSYGQPKQEVGGHWLITNQVGTWNFQNSVDWSGPSWDWYESHDRFPPFGGIKYPLVDSSSTYVNAAQATTYDQTRPKCIPTTYYPMSGVLPKINMDLHDRQLLWDNGERTTKRGMMISFATFNTSAVAELGNEWGANLVRWQLGPGGFPYSPADTWTTAQYKTWLYGTALPQIDAQIANCDAAGIKVLIDVHTLPGGWNVDPVTGSGWHKIFYQQEWQDCFIDIWDYIANKYKYDDRIWGYDLGNEPHDAKRGPVTYPSWNMLKQHVAERVRAIDSEKPIIIGCLHGPPLFFDERGAPAWYPQVEYITPVTGVNNIIYQAHMYEPAAFTNQGLSSVRTPKYYPGEYWTGWPLRWFDNRMMREYMQPMRDWQLKYGVPNSHMYIGEFSTIRFADQFYRNRWMHDFIDIMEEWGWNWCWHAFREYSGWGVENYEGAANSGIATYIEGTHSEYLMRQYYNRNKYGVDESGSFCTNSGANTDIIFNLPPAEAGRYYWFANRCTDSGRYNLRVKTYENDYIQGYNTTASTPGDWEIYTDIPNAEIQLMAVDDTNWYPVKEQPTWSSVTYSGWYKQHLHIPGDGVTSVPTYYITQEQTGTFFTCSGAVTNTTFYLPPSQAGLEYWFTPMNTSDGSYAVGHAYSLIIQADTGEHIRWPYTGDTYHKITLSSYSHICGLRAYDDTGWYTCYNYGTTTPST